MYHFQLPKVNQKKYYYTYMNYLFCTRYTYFICFIAVILNTLYGFYVLCLLALHLFVGK